MKKVEGYMCNICNTLYESRMDVIQCCDQIDELTIFQCKYCELWYQTQGEAEDCEEEHEYQEAMYGVKHES